MKRIFLPFEQGEQGLSRRFGGMGLGLSISKTLVELQDGTLEASSAGEGRGSTFTVSFSTVPPAAPMAARSIPRTQRARSQRLRILLVEDQPDTLRTLGRLLQAEGFEVCPTTNLAEAQTAATTRSFDVLVSDIGLPDGTGWDLMQSLPAQTFSKSIALSGYATEEDIRRSREAGFDEHIAKPVDPDVLLAAIQSAARQDAPSSA